MSSSHNASWRLVSTTSRIMGIIASAAPIEKFEPSQHHAGTVGVIDNAYAATTACHLATGRSSRNFCRDFR